MSLTVSSDTLIPRRISASYPLIWVRQKDDTENRCKSPAVFTRCIMATGFKAPAENGKKKRTEKPTGHKSPDRTSSIARPKKQNDTTNPPLTDAQAIAGLDNNCRHSATRKAVLYLRGTCPLIVANMFVCAPVCSPHAFCIEEGRRKLAFQAPSYYRGNAYHCSSVSALRVLYRGMPSIRKPRTTQKLNSPTWTWE